MRIKLFFFFLIFFGLFNNAFSNIEDRIIAKVNNEIITNYDLVNEVNTILALTNKPAKKNEFRAVTYSMWFLFFFILAIA